MTRLRDLTRPSRPGLRWTSEDQWHVTLRFYGSVEPGDVDALARSLAAAAGATPVLTATSGPRPFALSPYVWVLPVDGLASLAARLGPDERGFRGHITLARGKHRHSFDGLPAPELVESWSVDEFCLVKSDLRPEGARYQVLDRWRLECR